jgi:hypothetical protein
LEFQREFDPEIKRLSTHHGPKANPKTNKLNVSVVTSVLMPNCIETAGKVGENEDDANEAPMAVNPSKTVIPNFFFTDWSLC